MGKHTLDLLRKRDPTLPAINLRVASALPAWHTDSASAFRNSFHYDAASADLYIRSQRLENVGDLFLVRLPCLRLLLARSPRTYHPHHRATAPRPPFGEEKSCTLRFFGA